jgi:hypothetical protein
MAKDGRNGQRWANWPQMVRLHRNLLMLLMLDGLVLLIAVQKTAISDEQKKLKIFLGGHLGHRIPCFKSALVASEPNQSPAGR